MKDLSDGTSVYVEKKEGGQGEKEPFFLEATHFDKDGKEIAKKQYHYDSMDGMFDKIDRDFVSKDKQYKKESSDEKTQEKLIKDISVRGANGYGLESFTRQGSYEAANKLKAFLKANKNKTLQEIVDGLNKSDLVFHDWSLSDGFDGKAKISDYEEVGIESEIKGPLLLKEKSNKTNNSIGDITMTVLNDLTDFIKKVVKNEKEDEMAKVKNEDKRKLIDEIGGILKGKVDDEIIRTVIKKAEELSYEPSEDDKADNKCKNEEDDKKEDETENKCKNEEEEKIEEKEEKVEDEDDEEDVTKNKKVKNSLKDLVMGGNGKAQEQKLYVSRKERLEEGNKY